MYPSRYIPLQSLPWSPSHILYFLLHRHTTPVPSQPLYPPPLPIRALEAAKAGRRVPLLLDATSSHSVDTFLAYQRTQQIDMPQVRGGAGNGRGGSAPGQGLQSLEERVSMFVKLSVFVCAADGQRPQCGGDA